MHQVDEMIRSIRDAFIMSIPDVEWMDEETKQNTIQKVKKFIETFCLILLGFLFLCNSILWGVFDVGMALQQTLTQSGFHTHKIKYKHTVNI